MKKKYYIAGTGILSHYPVRLKWLSLRKEEHVDLDELGMSAEEFATKFRFRITAKIICYLLNLTDRSDLIEFYVCEI